MAIGRREFADVILVPFEMALRVGAGSVMPSYTDIDGVPVSRDRELQAQIVAASRFAIPAVAHEDRA